MSIQAPSYEQTIKIPFDMGPTNYPGLNGVGGLEKHGVLNLDSLNVTGTINAGAVNVTNINAANITSGNLASARMTANFLTAAQASISTLSSISANIGSITAGSITGTTITGALIRTSTGGSRVQLSDSSDAIQFLEGGTVRGSFTGGLSGGIKATNTVYTDTRGEGFGAFNVSGDYMLFYCSSTGGKIDLPATNVLHIRSSAGTNKVVIDAANNYMEVTNEIRIVGSGSNPSANGGITYKTSGTGSVNFIFRFASANWRADMIAI